MKEYEKLVKIYNEIDSLRLNNVSVDDEAFISWKAKAEKFFDDCGFKESQNPIKKINFLPSMFSLDEDLDNMIRKACQDGLRSAKALIKTCLEDLAEGVEDDIDERKACYSKVVIVHGHDEELKDSVASLLEKQGIEIIILSEQIERETTIVDKIEKYSNVAAAVCLFTADDMGTEQADRQDVPLKKRARQNVVFETGYYIGKLGRGNVVLLAGDGIEIPSDLSGVLRINKETEWRSSLLNELKKIGFSIDLNLR